ncbi:uncharacterized protein PHACADRAFT_186245 [Phanerochaete carnosa HHB-10118-sp]|uniref:DUF6533 domain-containing protein n=1 Tax=Phanerochaete carnosa (strain HHB-10118-sp) TaxID=650164 RepID=K5VQ58_PHACS|nr:uncharacterized protein PHACADRAFT_186245 [Phanerochaete carnosa HHB-10118-sp]EKM53618.1 hypothetical protein PHACADRAFT_186245 [Phanerochaete carnosa HHB-10118-sp]
MSQYTGTLETLIIAADRSSLEQEGSLASLACDAHRLAALLCYEILITLEDELAILWRQRINATSAVFFIVRLTMVLRVAYDLLPGMLVPITQTVSVIFLGEFLVLIGSTIRVVSIFYLWDFFLTAVFSALRTFAISNRNLALATTVFLLGVSPAAINISTVQLDSSRIHNSQPASPVHFNEYNPYAAKFYFVKAYRLAQLYVNTKSVTYSSYDPGGIVLLLSRIPAVIADALVLLVTALRTLRGVVEARRFHGPGASSLAGLLVGRASLAEYLVQDGKAFTRGSY